eukprot:9713265-Lingulodinium_polyedra.AAC.1
MVSPRRRACAGPALSPNERNTLLMPRMRSGCTAGWLSAETLLRLSYRSSWSNANAARFAAPLRRKITRAAKQYGTS